MRRTAEGPRQVDLFADLAVPEPGGGSGGAPQRESAAALSAAGDRGGQAPSPAPAGAPGAADDLAQTLAQLATIEELAAVARACRRCGLRAGCRGVVFGQGGEGPDAAGIVLIGEGPGATEDELGQAFVGKAGQLLDRILAAAGLHRPAVHISNVVLCRPPANRTPTEQEMAACKPYLERRLEILRPRIVVAMGATAVRALIHPRARITQVRGQWHRRSGVWVMPTYHPAALLRDPSKKRPVWEDFQQIRELHHRLTSGGGLAPGGAPPLPSAAAAPPPAPGAAAD